MQSPECLTEKLSALELGRREFIGHGLMLVLLTMGRSVWAQAPVLHFRPLSQPVQLPLADLTTAGRARQFVADAVTLASAATPNQPIRIFGMIVRLPGGSAADVKPEQFAAVCVKCPHEGCDVDFVADPSKLPEEVKTEIGHEVRQPVYVCPCHNSTFKSEDGERLAGPAPRGLYRFQVTAASQTTVEIGQVEEDLLIFI